MSFPPPPPPPPPPPQASAGRSFGPIRDSPRPHRGHSHHNSRGHGPRSTGPQGNFYQSANASRGQGLIPGGAFGQGRSYGPGSKFPQLPQSSGGPGAYDSRNGFDRNRGNFLQSSSRPPKGQNAPGSMYNLALNQCQISVNVNYSDPRHPPPASHILGNFAQSASASAKSSQAPWQNEAQTSSTGHERQILNGRVNGENRHGHAQKRSHQEAFPSSNRPPAKGQAPPPTPRFGAPLPLPPKVPMSQPIKPTESKKTSRNQLGLTPRVEETDLSEEEDDALDEEAALALRSQTHGSTDKLHVTYNGRTLNLSTASDIAAWIQERRRKFPTKAKILESKRLQEARKKAMATVASQAVRDRPKQSSGGKKSSQKDEENERLRSNAFSDLTRDPAARAQAKIEKLRKQLEKEEKRVARMKAQSTTLNRSVKTATAAKDDVTPSLLLVASTQGGLSVLNDTIPDPVPTMPEDETSSSDLSMSSSDTDDVTSSSGSSESESEYENDDEAPTEHSSKMETLPLGQSPSVQRPKGVCNSFQKTGRCKFGKFCKYIHKRQQQTAQKASAPGGKEKDQKSRRVTLYQRLVEQENRREDQTILDAIIYMGENGLLNLPVQDFANEKKGSEGGSGKMPPQERSPQESDQKLLHVEATSKSTVEQERPEKSGISTTEQSIQDSKMTEGDTSSKGDANDEALVPLEEDGTNPEDKPMLALEDESTSLIEDQPDQHIVGTLNQGQEPPHVEYDTTSIAIQNQAAPAVEGDTAKSPSHKPPLWNEGKFLGLVQNYDSDSDLEEGGFDSKDLAISKEDGLVQTSIDVPLTTKEREPEDSVQDQPLLTIEDQEVPLIEDARMQEEEGIKDETMILLDDQENDTAEGADNHPRLMIENEGQ